jgi:ATP-dependent Lon protease
MNLGDKFMGIPLMIQKEDNQRIELLKKDLCIQTKIDVVRAALTLLEKESERIKKIQRWKKAAKLVAKNSKKVNKEFQKYSRMKNE